MRHDLISQQITPNSYLVEEWWLKLTFNERCLLMNIHYPHYSSLIELHDHHKAHMYNMTHQ